ncbi:MAG: hypothetical protein DRZ76_01855 [Candidatus Nealsonbacteria bacterium]|nr:MAG: hypothetical protein DRZ76_01855 [Candidatus Nealsonbacteria bacterium]
MNDLYWQRRFKELNENQKQFARDYVSQIEKEYTHFSDEVYKKYGDTCLYKTVRDMRTVFCLIRQLVNELID